MILIHCPSAGCYWGNDVGATVEQASASFVTHWRAKHEPIGQTPLDPGASPDLLPIAQAETPPAKIRPSVSVVRRNFLDRGEPEMDDRGLTSGGTPPERHWAAPDPYPKAKRDAMKAKKMGRRFDG